MTDAPTTSLQGEPPPGTTCEEASHLSTQYYIPCGRPAVFYVKTRDPRPYAMCEMCADHNVRNRGAKIVAIEVPDRPWDATS